MNAQGSAAGPSPSADEDWLTLSQAARFLGVAQSTVRRWSDQGRLPAFYTPGGHRRFRRAQLESFVEHSAPGGRGGGPLVLVIDDDAHLRELLRANLELGGYAVVEADGGEQALAAVAGRAPDLVLLDLVLPGIDGWELLRRLQERHGSIPVIMFSGKLSPQGAAAAAERGAQGFVGKPFDPDELLAQARKLVPV